MLAAMRTSPVAARAQGPAPARRSLPQMPRPRRCRRCAAPPTTPRRSPMAAAAAAAASAFSSSPPPPPPAMDPAVAAVAITEPSEAVLALWRGANAVCFDVDCTLTTGDGLDMLAEWKGCGAEVARITSEAMDGTLSLGDALASRLAAIDCSPSDLRAFLAAHPPEGRLVPGAARLVAALQARGVAVYLISGGFRELTLPVARALGVPKENVFANRMLWRIGDDEADAADGAAPATMAPTRLAGFDLAEPTARNQGKPAAIRLIRRRNPYSTVVMVGDGITDLEAVQVSEGGADLFVGFGGVCQRPAVAAGADWYVLSHDSLTDALRRYRVAMVGAGAWASAAARLLAQNTAGDRDAADRFVDEVKMWVYDDDADWPGSGGTKKLSEAINETHENPKYLPGVALGDNVVADPDLESAVRDADVLVLCVPHQFVRSTCKRIMGRTKPGAIAVSLVKGMRVTAEGPQLISQMVTKYLGMDCSVLMGPNIARDVGEGELTEAVLGYQQPESARLLRQLFETPAFLVTATPDAAGAEMCGTLKNVVALAAGFVDGCGWGVNAKATVMRQGLEEMRRFAKALYPTVRDDTFFLPCGVADLVATCFGGRNRLVAEAYARAQEDGAVPKSFEELEAELLKGQKLQGALTACEVADIIAARGWRADYPLFTRVHEIVTARLPARSIVGFAEGAVARQEARRRQDFSASEGDDGFDLAGGFGFGGLPLPAAAATASLDESLGAFVPRARRRATAAAAGAGGEAAAAGGAPAAAATVSVEGGGGGVAGFNGPSGVSQR